MDSQLRHQVEDFYYLEAELLDERKLREWFELLAEDIRYWMPVRHNPLERPASVSEELSAPGDAYYFDDDWKSLKIRVERAYSKIGWAEVPPSRTRHLITNIRIKKDDGRANRSPFEFPCLPHAPGKRQRYLRRHAPGYSAARRRELQDRPAHDHPRSGGAGREKYQRVSLALCEKNTIGVLRRSSGRTEGSDFLDDFPFMLRLSKHSENFF